MLLLPVRFSWAFVRYWMRIFGFLFAPQLVVRHILAIIFFQSVYEVGGMTWKSVRWLLWKKTAKGKCVAALHKEMAESNSYTEWRGAYRRLSDLLEKRTVCDEDKLVTGRLEKKVQRYKTMLEEGNVRLLQYELR